MLGIIAGLVVIGIIIAIVAAPNHIPEKSNFYIAPDAMGNRTLLHSSTPAILRIDISGIIGDGMLTSEKFEQILLDSREDLLSDNRVKGVLLYINTPGGVVTDADNMYRALLAYKKKFNVPVYSFVDGLCASGGMYIASASDMVYATSASVIGSVGVILGPAFNFSTAMDKLGIQSKTLTQGIDKDMLNPFRPWKEGEDKSLRDITAYLYQQFVDIVVAGRKNLSRDKLVNEYGAQVYSGPRAQELGYVDEGDSNYAAALAALTAACGIKGEYQVVKVEVQRSLLSELAQGKLPFLTNKITHTIDGAPNPKLSGRFLYLYQP